ncbi:unnamed protein product [Cochlearia groenlandica]
MSSSLNVINVLQVKPSNSDSSESSPLSLPLTFFDLLWFKLNPVKRVIFYKLTNEPTRSYFDSVIVPSLTSSLSSSLSLFLPLAGRLVWDHEEDKPHIVYNKPNDAVSFTVAESNSTDSLSVLTGEKPFLASKLRSLVPELSISDESANIVSFQVTLFPKQGFCLGVNAHHAVLDGLTTTNFLKSWAYICKQKDASLLPYDLIPVFDRAVVKGSKDIERKMLNTWQVILEGIPHGNEPINQKSVGLLPLPAASVDPEAVRFTLELTREDMETLRGRLRRESSPEEELRLSTFVVTYSYALTCLIRARGGDPDRPVGYGFVVDCRKLVDPPKPSNYFGNCVSAKFKIPLKAGTFMGEEGFLAAARMISNSVEEIDGSMALKLPEVLEAFSTPPQQGTQMLTIAGSTRLGVYGLDFGWGRPARVMVVSIDQGGISLAESRVESGGVEVGFSLKKHEMDALIDILLDGLKM